MSHEIATLSSSSLSSAGPNTTVFRVNSPIPYLFGGLAFMLALIAMALLVLAWSYRRYEEGLGDEESKPAKNKVVEDDFGPRFVVIMPGKLVPTHIAKPKLILKHVSSDSVPDLVDGKFDDIDRGDEQV